METSSSAGSVSTHTSVDDHTSKPLNQNLFFKTNLNNKICLKNTY